MRPVAALCTILWVPLLLADPAKIVYSKSFPGSKPPFVQVEVTDSGAALYRETPDEDPVRFELAGDDTSAIFALVNQLERFQAPLEANLKVANMGKKTFRYENGAESHEVSFNYSLNESARLLTDWFERITETQQHHFHLESAVRFDKLGVDKTLLQLQAANDRNRLVGRARFLPLLDRVAKNESYLHMARERAASLADAFRQPPAKTE